MWWGRNVIPDSTYRNQTNGLVENGGEFLEDAVTIAGGQMQGLVLRSDGTVFSYGLSLYGGNEMPEGLVNVASLAVSGSSCWAIRTDGTVARWGSDEDHANVVAQLRNVKAIAWAGYRSYLALLTNGTLLGFSFENSIDPSTGLPAKFDLSRARPVAVGGQVVSNVAAIAAMGDSPIILKRDGRVFSLNPRRREPAAAVPEPVFAYSAADPVSVGEEVLNDIKTIAGGAGHCLALRSNGTVVAWGNNTYGATIVPLGLTNVAAIAAAEQLSLALRRDGTVVAWGGNHFGQASVPDGLSNVVAIAACGWFSMAIATGSIPASVHIQPHGRLEEMYAESDLVFKGRVVSTEGITNKAFPYWGDPHATRFEVVSVLNGPVQTKSVLFLHLTKGPNAWSGGAPPWHFKFSAGQSYIVFAASADKSDWLYSPSTNTVARTNEFRQLMKGEYVLRTLDDRPLPTRSVKEAGWLELNRLLTSAIPSNSVYAIQQLNAMSKACGPYNDWPHSGDFRRSEVARVVRPWLNSAHDSIAIAAIGCYRVGPECLPQIVTHASALVEIATSAPSIARRVAAIKALSGTCFAAVSNALPFWLGDSAAALRAEAVRLLPDFPGEACEQALRNRATDDSSLVRAAVAEAIGDGQITSLLGTLTSLFSSPLGPTNPLPPLRLEDLQGGGRLSDGNVGDVHTSSGYALLKFDVDLVAGILRTNLNDVGFRPNFLCKLAEKDAGPWLGDLVELLEARRLRIAKEAEVSGVEPRTNYQRALMALSGTYYRAWNILHDHLTGLPFAAFANGGLDHCLDELEQAGDTGSREPLLLYELYRMKGLNKRAERYRKEIEPSFAAFGMTTFLDKVDAKYPRNGAIPDQ